MRIVVRICASSIGVATEFWTAWVLLVEYWTMSVQEWTMSVEDWTMSVQEWTM